jgi:hypothetical protein
MAISDKLAAQALAKIREQDAEIHRLRKRFDLGAAIQNSLENPATGNGRNPVVSDIVRQSIFTSPLKPVKKSTRLQAEAERKKQLRRESDLARGLRPKD